MAAESALGFIYDPLTARLRFKCRELTNWLVCMLAFVVLAIAFVLILPGALVGGADAIAIVVLFYANFKVMPERVIKICCPHCRACISTDVQWICPSCGEKTVRTEEFPFINRCEHEACRAEPAGYACHHCNQPFFITTDRRSANVARRARTELELRNKTKRAAKVTGYKETLEDREKELAIAELDSKLKDIQDKIRPPKIKTPAEQKQDVCERDFQAIIGVREYCHKKEAEMRVLYANSPELLEAALDAIEEIRQRHC